MPYNSVLCRFYKDKMKVKKSKSAKTHSLDANWKALKAMLDQDKKSDEKKIKSKKSKVVKEGWNILEQR